MNGMAGGLASGIQSGAQLGMQYRNMQEREEAKELERDMLDARLKEQKLRMDMMKYKKEQAEKQQKWEEAFFNKLSNPNQAVLSGSSSTPAPAGVGPAQRQGAYMPAPTDPRQNMMQTAALASRAGQMPTFNALASQGLIDTPKNKREMSKIQTEAMTAQAKLQKAMSDAQVEKFKQAAGMAWINEGDEDSVAAGRAALGGDWKTALKLKYPDLMGQSTNQIIARAQSGDTRALEMLKFRRDLNAAYAGQPESPVYPQKEFIEDQKAMRGVNFGLETIDKMTNLVNENPGIVGTEGKIAQLSGGVKSILSRVGSALGVTERKNIEEKAFGKKATAASQFESLAEALAALHSQAVMRNDKITDRDIQNSKNALGLGEGWLSTVTAPEAITKLQEVRKQFMSEGGYIQQKRSFYERYAPIEEPKGRQGTNIIEERLNKTQGKKQQSKPKTTIKKIPTPKQIHERVNKMSLEEKKRRYMELLRKRQGQQ